MNYRRKKNHSHMLKCNLFLATRLHSYTLSPPPLWCAGTMIHDPNRIMHFLKTHGKEHVGGSSLHTSSLQREPKPKKTKSWISDNHSLSEQMRWHRGGAHRDLYCTILFFSNRQNSKQPKFRKWIIPEVWKEKKRDGGGGQTHEEIQLQAVPGQSPINLTGAVKILITGPNLI